MCLLRADRSLKWRLLCPSWVAGGALSGSCEEARELLEVQLPVLVQVEVVEETLDLQRHAELVAHHGHEPLLLDEALFVRAAAEGHERIDRVELILQLLRAAALLLEGTQELRELNLSSAILVHIVHEAEELFLAW